MATKPGLSRASLPTDPAALTESSTKGYVDDQALGLLNPNQFGDVLDSFPRLLASGSAAMTTGILYATGFFAPVGGSATKLRLATTGDALSGTGSYLAGVYTGASPAALTQRATITATAAAINSFYELALTAAVSWAAADFLAIIALPTGWTTPPRLRTVAGGGPGSAVLNAGNRLCATSTTTGQTTLPATANLTSGWSGSGAPHWWSLAA